MQNRGAVFQSGAESFQHVAARREFDHGWNVQRGIRMRLGGIDKNRQRSSGFGRRWIFDRDLGRTGVELRLRSHRERVHRCGEKELNKYVLIFNVF